MAQGVVKMKGKDLQRAAELSGRVGPLVAELLVVCVVSIKSDLGSKIP